MSNRRKMCDTCNDLKHNCIRATHYYDDRKKKYVKADSAEVKYICEECNEKGR